VKGAAPDETTLSTNGNTAHFQPTMAVSDHNCAASLLGAS